MKKNREITKVQTSGKVHFYMMVFIRVMLVLAFFGALKTGRWLVLFVAVLAFFVTFLPKLLEMTWGIKIPADFEVMIILFIYGTLFFGEVRGFYAKFWWWDILLNLGAAFALGLIGFTILYVLYRDDKIDASPTVIAFFSFSFAVAMGSVWEIFEFTIDRTLGFYMQQNSLTDTMGDIIVNAIGALIVSLAGYYYIKQGKNNIVSKFIINFIERNPKLFRSGKKRETSADKTVKLIKQGEGRRLEFKSTLRKNLHTNEIDRKIENSALKTVVAYLNTIGGTLLIGVSDTGKILGVEKDGFQTNDKMALHFTNLVKHKIGTEFSQHIQFEAIKIKNKTILRIDCSEASKPVFLKTEEGEEFYVRNGPATVKLEGSALIDYVESRFGRGNTGE